MNVLSNRVAIITGSTRGIGKVIAIRFARDGAKVVINGTRSIETAKSVIREI